jgi:hypothetical protein
VLSTSYTFTLNGSLVIPYAYSFTSKTATFSNLEAGTNYIITISSENIYGSNTSDPVIIPTTPSNITGFTNTSTATSFTINWLGGLGAASYIFTLNGQAIIPSSLIISSDDSSSPSSSTFLGLSQGTVYELIIYAVNSSGSTPSSNYTCITLPSQPSDLIVSQVTQTELHLSWSEVSGATSYIYKFNDTLITPTNESEQTAEFTNLIAGTNYIIIIYALNSGGSTASNEFSVITTPSTPYKITSSDVSESSFTINWAGGNGATSYLFTLNSSNTTPTNYDMITKTAYFDNLDAGSIYLVNVIAINSSGLSPSYTTLYVKTSASQPTVITSNTITTSGFSIEWLGGLGATSYIFELNEKQTHPTIYSGQSATFTDLISGTDYTVIVKAVDKGISNASEPVIITTLPTTPLQPSNITGSSYTSTGLI